MTRANNGTAVPAAHPVARIAFDDFRALGRDAVIRADVPLIIERLPRPGGFGRQVLIERLGDAPVTLFSEPSSRENTERWQTSRIPLREFFERYAAGADARSWHRIVSNIMNRPDDVRAIIGFEPDELFGPRGLRNAANLWISHRSVFTQSHFDELENFNIQLEGRKRFILLPPGFRDYYPRSLLRGFGDKSQAFDFTDVDPHRFPRLAAKLAQRRDIVLEPGEMLYLPLGWWHQAESLDELNINMNFWMWDPKILRRPYVLGSALYTAAYRKLRGVYNYQPEPAGSTR
ncbi:cupin-like domain-containing protein [Nocardia sp. CDC159]|uniref:Cupin-like domain-containing protein n=1 Tax=Nocardia pulmonis TaxID=2951408 RepID=A0A9X2J1L6_9NOCA|nr:MULTISPECIES: cupin-like domain-containing protein [Nocardia]MCM6778225.1 cupin-like domain-containing protein [Nocardia pulmonis]MCM6791114.1 cupin-like domain-containing protein [Nocardia sp. CDC159]